MKRLHLFEFEDQAWFPHTIRQGMMDYLRFTISLFNLYKPLVPWVKTLLEQTGLTHITDLCAGAGGGIVPLWRLLNQASQTVITVTLSDKYPNLAAYRYIDRITNGQINFIPTPLDVLKDTLPNQSLLIICSSFHHFNEPAAILILQKAMKANAPIAILEGSNRSYLAMIGSVMLHLVIFTCCTPFIRPFRFNRLLFTYILPLIPLCTIWDGLASVLRMYKPQELLQLAQQAGNFNYHWQAGTQMGSLGNQLVYLLGWPKNKRGL